MSKQNSVVGLLAVLLVLVSLFQNCAGSDFNVGEYTNSSNGALSIPVVAPDIISKSTDLVVTAGAPALFTVSTSGSDPVTYSWYKNGVLIPTVTESSYYIPATVVGDAATYAVSASNSAGSTSTTFQLTVTATPPPPPPATTAPVITTAPAPYVYIRSNQTIRLQVVATGANLTYQWYFKSLSAASASIIAGETASVYTRTSARASNSGTYSVVVANAGGSVAASSEVEVDIEPLGGGGGGGPRTPNQPLQ